MTNKPKYKLRNATCVYVDVAEVDDEGENGRYFTKEVDVSKFTFENLDELTDNLKRQLFLDDICVDTHTLDGTPRLMFNWVENKNGEQASAEELEANCRGDLILYDCTIHICSGDIERVAATTEDEFAAFCGLDKEGCRRSCA